MSDIELVIKIPEEVYEHILKAKSVPDVLGIDMVNTINAVKNSTPLPKGHGDLKDANKLKHAFISWSMAVQGNFTDVDIANIVCNSPTIIEADKVESEDV